MGNTSTLGPRIYDLDPMTKEVLFKRGKGRDMIVYNPTEEENLFSLPKANKLLTIRKPNS